MRMPSSTSVSPVSDKLGLAPVSHTLNTGDLVLRAVTGFSHKEAGQQTSMPHPCTLDCITTISVVLGFKHLHLPRDMANVNV